ncbi:O-methyltransferase [Aspergillus indologenus CBS 114.80]|uniref:catechol O-methyltransferase n=1 Tax=Aspergillus indologenus CBS 114.80 TaxID=1450541 RepID=A0A2V5HNA9_9EURO|nr:O-methyltransferase [Aspergillus indologenus CBS 114.80]
MTQFYLPEEAIYHNDGREQRLLEFILSHPDYALMKGCPNRILAAIDEYGREKAFLMNVGTEKGQIVSKVISRVKPEVIVELGGYIGYSALLFGDALRKAGGRKYISLKVSPIFASVSAALVGLAGLSDTVEIMVGPCRNSLRALSKAYPSRGLDMFFFDHAKVEYTNDLKLCEELGLVSQGTTVVADNVSRNPEYLEYVRASGAKKMKAADENKGLTMCHESDMSVGRPDLRYETSVVHSIEPTGEPDAVEISCCLGSS